MKPLVRAGTAAALTVAVLTGWQCVEGPAEAPDPGEPSTAVALDVARFDSLVVRQGNPAIVEFYSPTCLVCGAMAGVIDSLAVTFGDSLLVGTFNVEGDDSLWRHYITSVPTYVLFDSGQAVASLSLLSEEPWAYDSLATLVRALLAGTLVPDTAPPSPVVLTTAGFDSLVVRNGNPAVVEFHSPTSATCGAMAGVIDSLAAAFGDSLLVGAFDITSDDSLWRQYVTGVPTYVLFDSGVVRARLAFTVDEPWARDSLATLVRSLLAGTLVPDTADTTTPPDTLPLGLVELSTANFDHLVRTLGRVSMVEFYSPLCGACQTMFPVVDSLAQRFDGRALIGRVNIAEDDTLWRSFGVEWIPAFVFLRSGVEYDRWVGATAADTLAARIDRGLAKAVPRPAG